MDTNDEVIFVTALNVYPALYLSGISLSIKE
jgi:hypothetical protein